MKIQRYKKTKWIMAFYKKSFGFTPPYNVLMDATFCNASCKVNFISVDKIPEFFFEEVNFFTTECIIKEVEYLSQVLKRLEKAYLTVKSYQVFKCGHESDPKSAFSCIRSLLKKKNPHKFIMATMDSHLCMHIRRNVIGTPIIYLYDQLLVLERPCRRTVRVSLKPKMSPADAAELDRLKSLKARVLGRKKKKEEKYRQKNKSKGKTKDESKVKTEDEPKVKTEDEPKVKTEDESKVKTEDESKVKTEDESNFETEIKPKFKPMPKPKHLARHKKNNFSSSEPTSKVGRRKRNKKNEDIYTTINKVFSSTECS